MQKIRDALRLLLTKPITLTGVVFLSISSVVFLANAVGLYDDLLALSNLLRRIVTHPYAPVLFFVLGVVVFLYGLKRIGDDLDRRDQVNREQAEARHEKLVALEMTKMADMTRIERHIDYVLAEALSPVVHREMEAKIRDLFHIIPGEMSQAYAFYHSSNEPASGAFSSAWRWLRDIWQQLGEIVGERPADIETQAATLKTPEGERITNPTHRQEYYLMQQEGAVLRSRLHEAHVTLLMDKNEEMRNLWERLNAILAKTKSTSSG